MTNKIKAIVQNKNKKVGMHKSTPFFVERMFQGQNNFKKVCPYLEKWSLAFTVLKPFFNNKTSTKRS